VIPLDYGTAFLHSLFLFTSLLSLSVQAAEYAVHYYISTRMVSEDRGKEIFARHGLHVSKEEVTVIHNLLYAMATAEYKSYLKKKSDEPKSDRLHTRVHR